MKKSMKKLFILSVILLSINIVNAQSLGNVENRANKIKRTTSIESTGASVTPPPPPENPFTPEDQTWGLGYSYSQHFPITLSANLTNSYFSLGAELGLNLDGKKYNPQKYNPAFFLTVSPGFYCRYISINCGVGFMHSSYTKTSILKEGYSYTDDYEVKTDDGSVIINGSTSVTEGDITSIERKPKFNLMLKPSITGYIPICDEDYYITINAGYNYIPKFKELNGWSFGIGFQIVL